MRILETLFFLALLVFVFSHTIFIIRIVSVICIICLIRIAYIVCASPIVAQFRVCFITQRSVAMCRRKLVTIENLPFQLLCIGKLIRFRWRVHQRNTLSHQSLLGLVESESQIEIEVEELDNAVMLFHEAVFRVYESLVGSQHQRIRFEPEIDEPCQSALLEELRVGTELFDIRLPVYCEGPEHR